MADTLIDRWVTGVHGLQQRVDPEDLPDSAAAVLRNVEFSRPYGSVGPRYGCRSLPLYSVIPNGGHPLSPLGNSSFDATAEILIQRYDEQRRRAWAIVAAGLDGDGDATARAYFSDRSIAGAGFDPQAVSDAFKIDGDRLPDAVILDGRLIVATGSRHASRNVVIEPGGLTLFNSLPDPLRPPQPTVAAQAPASGETGISCLTGFTYKVFAKNKRTRATMQGSVASASTGAQTLKKFQITCGGVDDKAIYDTLDIYRTTDGGPTWRFVGSVNNPGKNQTVPFFDFTPDDRLSNLLAPTVWGRPPSVRYLLPLNDRLLYICKSDYPVDFTAVYFSEVHQPFNVDPVRNLVNVGRADGAAIVGAFKMYNRGFVIKANGSIWELADNQPQSILRADPLVNEGPWACVSQETIREVNGVVYWRAMGGVVRFSGESIEFVSTGIEPLILSAAPSVAQGLTSVPDSGPAVLAASSFTFTNTDAVPENFHFEVAYTTSSSSTPATWQAAIVITLSSATHPERFVVNNSSFPSAGAAINPGVQAALAATPPPGSLTIGNTYYRWVRASDSGPTDWHALGSQVAAYTQLASGEDAAWVRGAKSFAVDFHPASELWFFERSANSSIVDRRLVLNYDSIGSEAGPSWRIDGVHATSAILIPNLDLGGGRTNQTELVMGDAFGCLWVTNFSQAAGAEKFTDHVVDEADALTTGERHGTGTYSSGTLTQAAGMSPWPTRGGQTPGLNAQRVVIVDADGGTYVGIITTNTATTLTIGYWLEGSIPAAGTVSYAIGGIDAEAAWYPQAFAAPGKEKESRNVILRGAGAEALVRVECRGGEQCEEPTTAALIKMRRRVLADVRLGGSQKRLPVNLRGKWLGLAVSSWRAGVGWRLSAWGYGLIPFAADD